MVYIHFQVLHPGLKLEYFCKQGWEPEWIDNGKTITRDAFANYEGLDSTEEDPDAMLVNEIYYPIVDKDSSCSWFCSQEDDDFGNICVGTQAAVHTSELDKYLKANVVKIVNPLKWWMDNFHAYPRLSQMALNYLSIPGKFHGSRAARNC